MGKKNKNRQAKDEEEFDKYDTKKNNADDDEFLIDSRNNNQKPKKKNKKGKRNEDDDNFSNNEDNAGSDDDKKQASEDYNRNESKKSKKKKKGKKSKGGFNSDDDSELTSEASSRNSNRKNKRQSVPTPGFESGTDIDDDEEFGSNQKKGKAFESSKFDVESDNDEPSNLKKKKNRKDRSLSSKRSSSIKKNIDDRSPNGYCNPNDINNDDKEDDYYEEEYVMPTNKKNKKKGKKSFADFSNFDCDDMDNENEQVDNYEETKLSGDEEEYSQSKTKKKKGKKEKQKEKAGNLKNKKENPTCSKDIEASDNENISSGDIDLNSSNIENCDEENDHLNNSHRYMDNEDSGSENKTSHITDEGNAKKSKKSKKNCRQKSAEKSPALGKKNKTFEEPNGVESDDSDNIMYKTCNEDELNGAVYKTSDEEELIDELSVCDDNKSINADSDTTIQGENYCITEEKIDDNSTVIDDDYYDRSDDPFNNAVLEGDTYNDNEEDYNDIKVNFSDNENSISKKDSHYFDKSDVKSNDSKQTSEDNLYSTYEDSLNKDNSLETDYVSNEISKSKSLKKNKKKNKQKNIYPDDDLNDFLKGSKYETKSLDVTNEIQPEDISVESEQCTEFLSENMNNGDEDSYENTKKSKKKKSKKNKGEKHDVSRNDMPIAEKSNPSDLSGKKVKDSKHSKDSTISSEEKTLLERKYSLSSLNEKHCKNVGTTEDHCNDIDADYYDSKAKDNDDDSWKSAKQSADESEGEVASLKDEISKSALSVIDTTEISKNNVVTVEEIINKDICEPQKETKEASEIGEGGKKNSDKVDKEKQNVQEDVVDMSILPEEKVSANLFPTLPVSDDKPKDLSDTTLVIEDKANIEKTPTEGKKSRRKSFLRLASFSFLRKSKKKVKNSNASLDNTSSKSVLESPSPSCYSEAKTILGESCLDRYISPMVPTAPTIEPMEEQTPLNGKKKRRRSRLSRKIAKCDFYDPSRKERVKQASIRKKAKAFAKSSRKNNEVNSKKTSDKPKKAKGKNDVESKETKPNYQLLDSIKISLDLVRAAKRFYSLLKLLEKEKLSEKQAKVARVRYERIWVPLMNSYYKEWRTKQLNDNEKPPFIAPPPDVYIIWIVHMLFSQPYIQNFCEIHPSMKEHKILSPEALKNAQDRGRAVWERFSKNEPWLLTENRVTNFREADRKNQSRIRANLIEYASNFKAFSYQVSLPHYSSKIFLYKSLIQYKRFLRLRIVDNGVIPSYDIEFIWRTHQLHPKVYKSDYERIYGKDSDLLNNNTIHRLGKSSKYKFNPDNFTKKLWNGKFDMPIDYLGGCLYRGEMPESYLKPFQNRMKGLNASSYFTIRIASIKIRGDKFKKSDYRIKLKLQMDNVSPFKVVFEISVKHNGNEICEHYLGDKNIVFKVPYKLLYNSITFKLYRKKAFDILTKRFRNECFWSMSDFKDLEDVTDRCNHRKILEDETTGAKVELMLDVTKEDNNDWSIMYAQAKPFDKITYYNIGQLRKRLGLVNDDLDDIDGIEASVAKSLISSRCYNRFNQGFEMDVVHCDTPHLKFSHVSLTAMFQSTKKDQIVQKELVCLIHTIDRSVLPSLYSDNPLNEYLRLDDGDVGIIVKTNDNDFAVLTGWWEGRTENGCYEKNCTERKSGKFKAKVYVPSKSLKPISVEFRRFCTYLEFPELHLHVDLKNASIRVERGTPDFVGYLGIGIALVLLEVICIPRATSRRRIKENVYDYKFLEALGHFNAKVPVYNSMTKDPIPEATFRENEVLTSTKMNGGKSKLKKKKSSSDEDDDISPNGNFSDSDYVD